MSHLEQWKNISRHPRILYWFWNPEILENEQYLKDLHHIYEKSCYTTVVLSARNGMNFFDRSLIPHFKKAVELAHQLGFQIILQLWPEGFEIPVDIAAEEAVSLVSDAEGLIEETGNGKISLFCQTNQVRFKEAAPHIRSELLAVYAFRKMGEGKYEAGSLLDVTDKAVCRESGEGLEVSLELPDQKGYTIYAIAAHYYGYADLFSEFIPRSYYALFSDLKGVGFDSYVLDEFKNIPIKPKDVCFRDRFAGKAAARNFAEETGRDLTQVLFEMRYAEEGSDAVRISAINQYFDWMRKGPKRIESIIAGYVKEFCGKNAFLGLHNTFHNHLQGDEMWATGCNWWELPRQYAQTDENIALPVRMGISCQCPEAIHYDMFYCKEQEPFFRKAIEDARFGGRIHYHAMNDFHWGVNLGREDFLMKMNQVEKKISLLNWFDGPMPRLDLLIVFGMPALCNWYPDISARNRYDLNGKANIMERSAQLWNAGCRCALAPSDAIDDGRIQADADGFSYCGHRFSALLYLYPQYAKIENIRFLKKAVEAGLNVRMIGEFGRDYDGNELPLDTKRWMKAISMDEEENIIAEMKLPIQTVPDECWLENGACVYSSYESFETGIPRAFSCKVGDTLWEGEYIGCAAIQCSEDGKLEKFACGGFTKLLRNGRVYLEAEESCDIYWDQNENILHKI
ncbi:MAG: hypothetical protein ACOX6P_11565 [Candidatus Merdivicinus sp.]